MNNLRFYEAVRAVPQAAQRPIQGGRLKGKTDINPMWRLKTLTEQFGPVGFGWKLTIDRQWMEAGANGEVSAFCNISMFIKADDKWSDAIPGTGGSAFVTKESGGFYQSDECFKMALTDAISVACKMLGVGADVYWGADPTKYGKPPEPSEPTEKYICEQCHKPIEDGTRPSGTLFPAAEIAQSTRAKLGRQLCLTCTPGK